MAQSAFAYFRGTALIQAHDLMGIIVHSCRDCHLMNFGGFATAPDDPLFLQIKKAGPSVLERYTGHARVPNNGQRMRTDAGTGPRQSG
jgi:uncharacterized protein (DUF2252 family)